MYLYLCEFSKRKGLVKIGISKNLEQRVSQLELSHGKLKKNIKVYQGSSYKEFERLLHKKYNNSRIKVRGDGGTEFFKKECVDFNLVFETLKLFDMIEYVYEIDKTTASKEKLPVSKCINRKIVNRKELYINKVKDGLDFSFNQFIMFLNDKYETSYDDIVFSNTMFRLILESNVKYDLTSRLNSGSMLCLPLRIIKVTHSIDYSNNSYDYEIYNKGYFTRVFNDDIDKRVDYIRPVLNEHYNKIVNLMEAIGFWEND